MQNLIDLLEKRQLVWRGHKHDQQVDNQSVRPSGYQALDQKINGGFPAQGVVLLHSDMGIGEIRLLLPSLLETSGLCAFINPPGLINAEFLFHQGVPLERVLLINTRCHKDALWAAEQCLKSGACSTSLLWQNHLEVHHVQRLQSASEQGQACQFIFRTANAAKLSLPVQLNLHLHSQEDQLRVHVVKRKGGWPIPAFSLNMTQYWPQLSLKSGNNVVPFPAHRARSR